MSFKITFEDEAFDAKLMMIEALIGFCVKITFEVPPTRAFFCKEVYIEEFKDLTTLILTCIDDEGQETGEQFSCCVSDIIEIHVL